MAGENAEIIRACTLHRSSSCHASRGCIVAHVRVRLARRKGCLGVTAYQLMSCVPYFTSAGGLYAFCSLAFSLRFMCSMFCDRLANFALCAEPPSLHELNRR